MTLEKGKTEYLEIELAPEIEGVINDYRKVMELDDGNGKRN